MKGNRVEAEVIVRLDQFDGCAHICVVSWPAMFRKMTKLYGPSLDGAHPGKSARWRIPLKQISFRRVQEISRQPRRVPTSAFKRRENTQSGEMNV